MTNIEDGSRAHAAHGSGDVRANSGLAFANLTHLPHLPHLPSNNSCGYEEDPTSRNAPGERATVDQGLVISELRAENERLRAYEEEAERQFSEHADEWGRITARLAAVEALCDAAQPLVLSGGPFGSVALGGAVLSAARVRAALRGSS